MPTTVRRRGPSAKPPQAEAEAAGDRDLAKLKDERAWEKGREKQVESLEKET